VAVAIVSYVVALLASLVVLGVFGGLCLLVVWLDLTEQAGVSRTRRLVGATWAIGLAMSWLIPRSTLSHVVVAVVAIGGIGLWVTSWRTLSRANRSQPGDRVVP
jgi:hypothetical protein